MSAIAYPPAAPNACPRCGHTPLEITTCFSWDIKCLDWRGNEVPCLCVHDCHFSSRAAASSPESETQ